MTRRRDYQPGSEPARGIGPGLLLGLLLWAAIIAVIVAARACDTTAGAGTGWW